MLKIGKQGKIKGGGTTPHQIASLHRGWRGTRFESRSAGNGTACNRMPTTALISYANVVSASLELP